MTFLKCDHEAAEAIAWARRRRVAVPRRLPAPGLDDSPEYYGLGLSRCEVDWDRLEYVMAHRIIGDIPVVNDHEGFVPVATRGGG